MLLLHTAGFGYDFFNEHYNRLARSTASRASITASQARCIRRCCSTRASKWEYGSNIDWAGQVVEGITGKRLGEVMQERIFEPLGMTDTAFSLTTPCARAWPRHAPARTLTAR